MLEFYQWLNTAAEHLANKEWQAAAYVLLDALPEEGIENGDVPPEEAVASLTEFLEKLPKGALGGLRSYLFHAIRAPKADPFGIFFGPQSFAMRDILELLWLTGSRRLRPIKIVPVIAGFTEVVSWNVTFSGYVVYNSPDIRDAEAWAIHVAHHEQKIGITATLI
jgi:hypothetical protein